LEEAGEREYSADDDAATVTLINLEEEIRQTEGLMVTVNKVVGGPNMPMGHCFKQTASNFPMLDDLKEYVQKHFGPGEFRAYYRVGNKIKYNIPFTVSANLVKPSDTPAPAPVPQPANGELREFLAYLRERDEQQRAVQAVPVNPMQQVKDVMEVMRPFLPLPNAVPVAGGDMLSGLRQMMEVKELLLADIKGLPGNDDKPWWADFAKDLATGLAPVLGGIVAAVQAKRAGGAAPPIRDVSPQPVAIAHQETPLDADPKQAAIEILAPLAGQLEQLDAAAKMLAPAAKCAEAVVDKTPVEALPVLEGLANPANREHALAAVFHYVPAARDRFAWWDALMQGIYADLTAPEEPGNLPPSNPG
jgi:hypothetical protein